MLEKLFELQKPFMAFLQSISNPALTAVATGATYFGEAGLCIIILFILLWGLDKKRGFKVGLTLIASLVVMNVLKLIFRVPRPFVVYPELECLRLSTATGYSFPSGHTTCAAALMGALLVDEKKTWKKVVYLVIIALTALSRCYLQCHWPMDVIVGAVIGILFAFYASSRLLCLYDEGTKLEKVCKTTCIISVVLGLGLAILIQAGILDDMWKDMMETFGMLGGITLGVFYEKTKCTYRLPEGARKRALAVIAGAIPGLIGYLVLDHLPVLTIVFKCPAYFFIAFWAVYLYPVVATKYGILLKEEQ